MSRLSPVQFVQKVNPVEDRMEWLAVDEDYDYNQEIATSAYADMLHDDERNKKFGEALKSAIKQMHRKGKKAHVLDIGTGTGLLSMLAVKYGADTVVACETFLPMANCAINVIKYNHFKEKIKVVKKHSTALTVGFKGDLKQKANILVSEVFDTELIGEGAIKTFNHAHTYLLESDCIVIPSSGTIYAQVVESSLAQKWNKLADWEHNENVVVTIPKDIKSCSGAAAVHDLQLSQVPKEDFKALSPVLPVLRFDWSTNNETSRQTRLPFKASATGNAQMVLMWWDLVMDTAGKKVISCAPVWEHPDRPTDPIKRSNPASGIPWRDHWIQAIYYFGQDVFVEAQETYHLVSNHDEFSLWFQMSNDSQTSAMVELETCRPICMCGFHFLLSRTRIGAMNDQRRRDWYMKTLTVLIKPTTVCLFVGDISLLPLIAVHLGAKHVFVINQNDNSQTVMLKLAIFNDMASKITFISNMEGLYKYLRKEAQNDTEFSEGMKNILMLSEPFYRNALLPWDNVHLWYQSAELARLCIRHVESIKTIRIPTYPGGLLIRACPMQFDDLWKISTKLKSCKGFDMTWFDHIIGCAKRKAENSSEPQPLWEYPGQALAAPVTLLELNLGEEIPGLPVIMKGEWEFTSNSRCDGVALWVDYTSHGETLSLGPLKEPVVGEYVEWDKYEKQGVHLFRSAHVVNKGSRLNHFGQFQPQCGEFYFGFTFSS